MPVMLDYRSPSLQRTTVRRCLAFAVTLIGLAVSLIAPLAISVAGVYWNDPPLVLIGAILSGVLLATAFGLAAAAVEQLCDLRD